MNFQLKTAIIVAVVFGVGLISYYTIRSIQKSTKDNITIEYLENQQEKVEKSREKISRPSSSAPTDDVDSILRGWESRKAD